MFVDQPWDDADIASLYDAFPFTEDLAFYAGLAGTQGGPVLELGCGSGRILVPLARRRRPGSGGGRGGRGGGRIRRARGAARRRRRCHRAWFSSVPTVLDGGVLVLVVRDLDAAAGVVAHGHAAFAAPADGQALQQRDPFPGRAGPASCSAGQRSPAPTGTPGKRSAEPVGSDVHNDEVSAA
jgi:hypothetical protein